MASLIKDTGIITLSRIGSSISMMIVGIVTARYLGPDGPWSEVATAVILKNINANDKP
jgi:hypothetical protein